MLLNAIRGITVLYVIVLTLLLELPAVSLPDDSPGWGLMIGKEHVIAFTLLGLLVEFCRRKKSMLFWVGVLLFYSLATEVLQGLLNSICRRVFDWKDFSHDVLGVLIGTLLAYFCCTLFVKVKSQHYRQKP